MRALQYITDHVIFKLRYNQIYQMKTPLRTLLDNFDRSLQEYESVSSDLFQWNSIDLE